MIPVTGLLSVALNWISAQDLGRPAKLCSLTQYHMLTGCCSTSGPSSQGAGKKILELAVVNKRQWNKSVTGINSTKQSPSPLEIKPYDVLWWRSDDSKAGIRFVNHGEITIGWAFWLVTAMVNELFCFEMQSVQIQFLTTAALVDNSRCSVSVV